MVRVRFAPSPTGALHIGGVRTALFNYLFIFGAHFPLFGADFSIPAMGVTGAAIATVFSRFTELVITVGWAYRKRYEACGTFAQLFSFTSGFLARFVKIAF